MATYTVIQDIEAEDKFVGPLTFKQFIFAMTGLFFSWVCFFFITKEVSWGLVVSAPLAFFGFFMAFPWSKEQPTDVWVLAKIRFRIKPKKRVWDQAGRQDLVTITAPKKIEKHLTKDFDETEVKSRLKALADTIDSRGWVVKHSTASEASSGGVGSTDRLIDTSILPAQVPDEAYDLPDIMENSKMDGMINENDDRRRGQIAEKMDRVRRGETYEATDQPEPTVASPIEDNAPQPKNTADRIDEMLLSDQIKAKKAAGDVAYSRMSTLPAKPAPTPAAPQAADPDDDQVDKTTTKPPTDEPPKAAETKSTSTVTDQVSPDILNLARNNDLNVATIARQANNDRSNGEEVVISLH